MLCSFLVAKHLGLVYLFKQSLADYLIGRKKSMDCDIFVVKILQFTDKIAEMHFFWYVVPVNKSNLKF